MIGHSLGDYYVNVFAGNYPNEVASSILIEPAPYDYQALEYLGADRMVYSDMATALAAAGTSEAGLG